MHHYHIGVEHLFIAMAINPGGETRRAIERNGLTSDYVIDLIRRRIGKGSVQRMFAGMPYSPRADVVMSIANDLALERGRAEIAEADLLDAILEEGESIVCRMLRALKLDQALADRITQPADATDSTSATQILFRDSFEDDDSLTPAHYQVLRGLFGSRHAVRIERRLHGGYTNAILLLVTPLLPDHAEDAMVVVKLDSAERILDEAHRFTTQVRETLPALTARMESMPAVSENGQIAGIRYTLVAGRDGAIRDLVSAAAEMQPEALAKWLHDDLFEVFGKTWWKQRRPYRFQARAEYDWLLPPYLTLDGPYDAKGALIILRDPVRRLNSDNLDYGMPIRVEDFVISRIDRARGTIELGVGRGGETAKRSYRVEIRGLDLERASHFRGEVVDVMAGRLWKTRNDILEMAVSELLPDFDLRQRMIPGVTADSLLPNPLSIYDEVLERTISGTISRIHGDLHASNILLGQRDIACLIDFAQARNGHTLFDWACLECSLLESMIAPATDGSWNAARSIANGLSDPELRNEPAHDPSVKAIRGIVHGLLAKPDRWSEYFTALAFCALRAASWQTASHGARRASFYLSAMAFAHVVKPAAIDGTPSSDHTEADPG